MGSLLVVEAFRDLDIFFNRTLPLDIEAERQRRWEEVHSLRDISLKKMVLMINQNKENGIMFIMILRETFIGIELNMKMVF